MACAFQRGSTTGPDGLTITVRDMSDNLIDPYLLRYAVFDYTTGVEVLIGSPVNNPIRMSLGKYYASVVLPADSNIGVWRIRWTIQETAVDPVYESVEEFQVVGDSTIASFTGDANMDALMHSLRIILRDNNPDRNYRFRPPASEKFIQGQTQVFGFIWEDEELLEYLYMAVDDFNSRPPTTGIEFHNLWGTERRWRTTIIMRAAAFACFAIAMNWIADEFSLYKGERLTVRDENGNDYSLPVGELFDTFYGDKIRKIEKDMKKECAEAIKELENETF